LRVVKKYKKRIQRDKENYLMKKCKAMEEHNEKGRTRELHQQIREITGKSKINTGLLKSRAGTDYTEKDKIITRWKEYTEDLYKKDPNISGKSIYTGTISDEKRSEGSSVRNKWK